MPHLNFYSSSTTVCDKVTGLEAGKVRLLGHHYSQPDEVVCKPNVHLLMGLQASFFCFVFGIVTLIEIVLEYNIFKNGNGSDSHGIGLG